jgi:5-methylcytosine-specific restriction endonuclease McrA
MRTMAKRAGGDKRGSAATRRARKLWLLCVIEDRTLGWAPFGGNGETVPCVFCRKSLTFATIEADRIIPGGSYRRENVQPACRPCNLARSDDGDLTVEEIAERVARTFARTGRLTPALVAA